MYLKNNHSDQTNLELIYTKIKDKNGINMNQEEQELWIAVAAPKACKEICMVVGLGLNFRNCTSNLADQNSCVCLPTNPCECDCTCVGRNTTMKKALLRQGYVTVQE